MTVIDATEIDDPVTRDEMLAMAIYARAGDVLTEHQRGCPADGVIFGKCTCRPLTLKLGAKA